MPAVEKQALFDVTITGLTHEGRGVAVLPTGKRCFVSQALVGEQLQVRITREKRTWAEAEPVTYYLSSPERVVPQCPHFGVCGGCQLQHMQLDAQIQMKQAQLLEQLSHVGQVVPEAVATPLTGTGWGYRRKARIGLRYVAKKGKLVMGFREQGGRYLTDSHTCAVLRPEISQHYEAIRQCLESLSVKEHLAQLEIAVGDDAAALILRHLEPLTAEDHEKLVKFAQQKGFHWYLQPKGMDSVHRIWPMEGQPDRLHYALSAYQLNLAFHPTDFVQVNAEINQAMVAQALDWLEVQPSDKVLDLFCGLGNFSLPLARGARSVVAVEGAAALIERLKENAQAHGFTNIEPYVLDLDKNIEKTDCAAQSYDKLLIDPPRAGAAAVLPWITHWKPERIVYVSCNPATLARDAGILSGLGYRLAKVGVMDMFPHTEHTEAMALFVR